MADQTADQSFDHAGAEHAEAASDGEVTGAEFGAASEPTVPLTPQVGHALASDDGQPDAAPLPLARPLDDDVTVSEVPPWLPMYPGSARHTVTRPSYSRRRRRYIFYLRRSSRARNSARSLTLVRAAWASVAVLGALIATVIVASVGAAASYYQSESPVVAALNRTVTASDSVRIYDDKNTLLYEFRDFGTQHSISLANVPVDVVNATVATEDHTFWTNDGVDLTSIGRAAQANLSKGRVTQGGSTITQQLVKNKALNDRTDSLDRKLREAIISVGLTTQGAYSKQQIMEMYLNSIDYGHEAYGIDAAAQIYFSYLNDPASGVSAAQHLDLAQASMLAGIPQNPNTNDPLSHFVAAHTRQRDVVLAGMVQLGFITQKQADAAYAEAGQPNFFHPQFDQQNLAPHFVQLVKDQLKQMVELGQVHLSRSGLNVYTTLDMDLQNASQAAMKNHLYGNDLTDYKNGGYIRDNNVTNSAGLLVEHKTGDIKVYLGSVDYNSTRIDGKFDVLKDGYRGPGSSFKPFVYATAFEKGWFPAQTISDLPTVFWDEGTQHVYKPLDFNFNDFWGTVTLRTALQNSLNIPAVKTMEYAGVDNVRAQVTRMGITQTEGTWGLSAALGAIQVTPYEMVQAYTVFANYGQYIPLHSINRITDSTGDVLFQYQVPRGIQVMSPQIAYLMTSMLTDNHARAKDFGGCNLLYLDPEIDPNQVPGKYENPTLTKGCGSIYTGHGFSPAAWPDAAKTGTGEDFKDDWTMGYTMDYTMGVWVGNNNSTPMTNIDGVTGAAPIWYHTMLAAEQNLPKRPFPVPSGIQTATYTSNGMTSTDVFLAGALPPQNVGSASEQKLPCIVFHDDPNNPWDYSSGGCQGRLIPNGPPLGY